MSVDADDTGRYRLNALGQRVYKQGKALPGDANGDGLINSADLKLVNGKEATPIDCAGPGKGKGKGQQVACVATQIGPYARNGMGNANGQLHQVNMPGNAETWFAYDEGGQLIGEYHGDGTPVQETVYLGGLPMATVQDGITYAVHTDHLGTPRAITNAANDEVWRWDSDPFGVAEPNEDPDGCGQRLTYNLRYPGQYFDAETGLHYNYFRGYDPTTGRYVQSDPIGLEGGLNTYAYVANNPLTRIDPTGLDWVYSQSTGQLIQVTNGQTQQGQGGAGYAGSGQGLNNPVMQNVPNVGPIPQGTYDIGQQRNSPNTGPGILPLTPQPGTNTYGRDNFQIHGDNRQSNQSASQGCMIFDRNTRNQISNSGDNVLRVVP